MRLVETIKTYRYQLYVVQQQKEKQRGKNKNPRNFARELCKSFSQRCAFFQPCIPSIAPLNRVIIRQGNKMNL